MATRKAANKPQLSEARVEEIRASARSGWNWAAINNYQAACTCGLRAAKGVCYRRDTETVRLRRP